MKYAIGLDIGGTKIAAGIISNDGDILFRSETKSDVSSSESMYKAVKETLTDLMDRSQLSWDHIIGIGAGIPGKVDSENGVAIYQNNLPWPNFPVVRRLKEDFPINNVVVDNDVYMATFAEWKNSDAKDEELFAYVTISTGIASALIQNETFLRGAGFAGELGQIPVTSPFDDVKVTLEQAVAGPAIQKAGQKCFNDVSITTRDVFMKHKEKDPGAVDIINGAADALAEGLYTLITLCDPHQIVIGGSVATNNPAFVDLIVKKIDRWALPDQKHILSNIHLSKYSNLSGLVGAGLRVFHK